MIKHASLIRWVVFFTSASTFVLEFLQIRILSFLFFAPFVYFTITIALFGTGLAGVSVCLASKRKLVTGYTATVLLAIFSISVVICLRAVSILPPLIDSIEPSLKILAVLAIMARFIAPTPSDSAVQCEPRPRLDVPPA